jgi:hypothetical protein
MKNKIFYLILYLFLVTFNLFAQPQVPISNHYGVKFLSFKYQPKVHFVGLSLPLISGNAVSEKFSGIDFGLFLSGCSKFKFYQRAHLDKYSIRVYNFKGIAVSGALTSTHYFHGLSVNAGLTSIEYFSGFSIGGISSFNELNGVSLNWLGVMSSKSYGFTFGGVISGSIKFEGVSASFILSGAKHFKGLSIGTINLVDEEIFGVQIGIINYCKKLYGIQIGLLNIAENAIIPYTLGINLNF